MGRLREWSRDWLGRSNTRPSDRKIDDPLTILQRIFATLAAIVAVLSNAATSILVPNLNANAAVILRIVVTLATLVAVNYVVTAKDTAETVSGLSSYTVRTYRFSNTDRLIARGIVVVAIVMLILNLVPAPQPIRNCDLTAIVRWQQPMVGTARPLLLLLSAGDQEDRYPVQEGKPVAMQVPSAHLSSFSITLLWSDTSRSDFGQFSGCSEPVSKESDDDRAKINLTGR